MLNMFIVKKQKPIRNQYEKKEKSKQKEENIRILICYN